MHTKTGLIKVIALTGSNMAIGPNAPIPYSTAFGTNGQLFTYGVIVATIPEKQDGAT